MSKLDPTAIIAALLAALENCQTTLHWLRDDANAPAWIRAQPGRWLIAEVDEAIAKAKGKP